LDWTQGRILREFQLIYISEGEGMLETKRAGVKVVAGDLFLLRPSVWHRYRPTPSVGWTEHWVGFDGPWANRTVLAAFAKYSIPKFHIADERAVAASFHALQSFSDLGMPSLQPVLAGHTLAILGWLFAASQPAKRSAEGLGEMQVAMTALASDDADRIHLPGLAKSLNMSYSRFRRDFNQRFGVSPHQFRLHCKLTEARHLLRSTHLSVKEVAARTGFASEQYFCRLFKEHVGCTPGDLRKAASGAE
jgi:AraC-like DNA-binding protein